MTLTYEEVAHIAALAHLDLSADALALYQEQLSAILDYAARLQAVDTAAIPPTASVSPLHTILRDDGEADGLAERALSHEDALHNAPATAEGCFLAPPLRRPAP